MNSPQRLDERVTELETVFTHLQRSVHDLDKVILDQQKQIDALRGQIARLMNSLERLPEIIIDAREERPPHY